MSGRALDRSALGYLRYWEPVLAAPAARVLTRLPPAPASFLDLGAGTGSLTLAAASRWPAARISALDASGAMLAVARDRVDRAGDDPSRFAWLVADARSLPLAEASFEAVGSSFVLQLFDDRPTVLAEVRRVLRAGAAFAFVTWLAEELELPAEEAFLDALEALGLEPDEEDDPAFRSPRPRDYGSLEEAREELVAVGFDDVVVERDELRYAWDARSYLAYKVRYDERDWFAALEPAARRALRSELRRRFARLPREAFEIRGPLVAGAGRRPDR